MLFKMFFLFLFSVYSCTPAVRSADDRSDLQPGGLDVQLFERTAWFCSVAWSITKHTVKGADFVAPSRMDLADME